MKQKAVFVILFLFVFQSCRLKTSGTWRNEHIDISKRGQIKLLNNKLFNAIMNNDASSIKEMMSEKLLENGGKNIDPLIDNISKAYRATSYRILDEYYTLNESANINNSLPSGKAGENAYSVNYLALNKEMYVSLLLPNGLKNDLLITAIYGNYSGVWKLNILHLGEYSFLGKTAPGYYDMAKKFYEKSYLIDAINNIYISKQCLKPAGPFFQFEKEKEIEDFYDRVLNEVKIKYPLPLTLTNIKTNPKIFNIYPEMTMDGLFPMVRYISTINLKDTTALKAENELIKKETGQLFTGISADNKIIFYQAFNELPDGKHAVSHYGFTDGRLK